jgi:putative sterol carrier protein
MTANTDQSKEPLITIFKRKIEEYSKRPEIVEKLSGINASVQVRPLDDGPFFIKVSGGEIEIGEGEMPDPLVTVVAKRSDLIKLINQEADPFSYYFSGKIRVMGRVLEAAELLRVLLRRIK